MYDVVDITNEEKDPLMLRVSFWEDSETRKIAQRALVPAEGALIYGCFERGILKGVMSFRFVEEDKIKRICTATFPQGLGIGALLVETLRENYPNKKHFCFTRPESRFFPEKLGMKLKEVLPDGRLHFEDN